MKIGILGTGFGAYHVEVYKNISDSNTIKIYGRNTEKLASLGEKLRIETTNDIESIITDKNIDLVDVCLPSSIHKKYVIEALKNGKDVFCETPAALNMEDASQMLTASKKYGGRVFVDNFIKFDAPYKYLYDTINNNSLGKLNVLHMKRKTPPFWGSL